MPWESRSLLPALSINSFLFLLLRDTIMRLHLRESMPRMADGEGEGGKSNHNAIQDDEVGLILHNRATPAVSHLGNAVCASRENGHVSEEDCAGEDFEAKRVQEPVTRLGQVGAVAVDSGGVEPHEATEDEQGYDLPHNTCDHHIIPRVQQVGVIVGCGGDATSGALKDQGEDIREDEDPGVEPRAEDAELRAELDDDVFEGQVYTRGDEGWGDDQTADLGLEARAGPSVGVHNNAANVADCLGETAEGEGDPEGPCSVANALDQLDQTAETEERAEKSIGAEIWFVAVDCQVHGAVHGDIGAVLGGFEGRGQDSTVRGVGLRTFNHVDDYVAAR